MLNDQVLKYNLYFQPTDGNVSGTLGGSDQSNLTSLECLKNVLAAHRTRRQYREVTDYFRMFT